MAQAAPPDPERLPAPAPVPAPQASPAAGRKPRTLLGTLGSVGVVAVSLLYLINPTAGLVELLPDNLIGVGNLDEAGATAALLFALRYLLGGRGGSGGGSSKP